MRKLKSFEVTLRFPNLDTIEKWELLCFSNASFSNLKSRSSQVLWCFYVVTTNTLLLHESKKKLKRVVKITLFAETLALEEALGSCFMIKLLLCGLANKEMHHDIFQIDCYNDNKSLEDTVNSIKTVTEKRLEVDVCIIREMIEKKQTSKCNNIILWIEFMNLYIYRDR